MYNILIIYKYIQYKIESSDRFDKFEIERSKMAPTINNNNININNPKPGPKPRAKCCAEGCTQKPATIIGDCAYCESRFCAQHRLPETHECVKMKQCRQIAKTENTQRLNSQAMSSVMNVGY